MSKKEKKDKTQNTGKRFRKRFLMIPVAVILVVVLVMSPIGSILRMQLTGGFSGFGGVESTVNEQVLSEAASTGTIESVLATGGSISEPDSSSIKISQKVSITSLEVSNGDVVKAGDVIAHVDKSTTLLAIMEIQGVMDELDEAMEEARDKSIESTMKSSAAGRVKAVFAAAGESVVNTMYEHDALILISLDGQMQVEIKTDASPAIGESVQVKTSAGKTYTGKVAGRSSNTVTVTVSDENTVYGDEVTVLDNDGKELGTGTLGINSEYKITGYSGTVKKVKVSVDDEIETGDTVLTLEDTSYTATYQALLNQRHTLEEQMQELFTMYQSGTIIAASDGVVANLDKDLVEVSAATNAVTAVTMSMRTGSGRTSSKSGGIQLMGAKNAPVETEETVSDFKARVVSVGSGELQLLLASKSTNLKDYTNLSNIDTSKLSKQVTLQVPSSVGIYKYSSGAWKSIKLSSLKENQTIICSFDSGGNLLWIIAGKKNTVTETTQETTEEETPEETQPEESQPEETQPESRPAEESQPESQPGESVPGESQPGESIPGESVPGESQPGESMPGESQPGESMPGESQPGESVPGESQPGESQPGGNMPSGGGNMPSGGGGMNWSGLSGISGGNSALSQAAAAESAAEEEAAEKAASEYSVSEDTLCDVTPQDKVTIEVTVDELDILSLSVGDEAQITLDALTGQSFTGTISKINTTGTNNGGNTKFTVEVTMDRSENMYTGMNAAVNFVQKVTSDVITVPAAAINEEGNRIFVYTSYDEKEDVLGDPVEVTTGVSDGTNVEIKEGLSVGDTYYYRYADSITWSFSR